MTNEEASSVETLKKKVLELNKEIESLRLSNNEKIIGEYGASHLVPQLAAPRGQFWEKSSKLRIVSYAQKCNKIFISRDL